MKKIFCGLVFICALLVWGISVNAVSKDIVDKTDIYNNLIFPDSIYKPVTFTDSESYLGSESFEPATGNLEINRTDYTLKGRNGFDLVLARYYSSSQSNLYDTSITSSTSSFSGQAYRVNGTQSKTTITFDLTTGNITNTATTTNSYTDSYCDTEAEASSMCARYNNGYYNHNNEWSSGADLYYEVVSYSNFTYASVTVGNTNYYTYSQTNGGKSFVEKYYDLGSGWAFNFPMIEKRAYTLGDSTVYRDFLHYGNEGTWQISFGGDGGNSHLKGYPLNDLVLNIDGGSFNSDGLSSRYVLTEKTGIKTYFGSDGRLLGMKDRFGNQIKFQYTTRNGYPVISKIVDSVLREINFSYTNDYVSVTIVDGTDSSNIVTIKYNKTSIPGQSGKYFLDNVQYLNVNGTREIKESYEYQACDSSNAAKVTFFSKIPSAGISNYYACLTKIYYPSDVTTNARPFDSFSYEKFSKNCGADGSMELYRVNSIYCKDRGSYKPTKERIFSYEVNNSQHIGQYDGFPYYSYSGELPSDYKIKTSINNYSNNTTYVFNKKMLCTSLSDIGIDHNIETITEYDSTKDLATKIVTKIYNINNLSQFQKKVVNYSYDTYGNIIGAWDVQASRDANDNPIGDEHKTTYTYNSTYHYLTSKSYKRDANTTLLIENTPSADNKTITWSTVKENGVYKQKTNYYAYDSYGNLIEKRDYLDNWTDYVVSKYDYTDNVSARNNQFNGAYLTRMWYENVRDADNNLVTARTGNSAGIVDGIYIFDWFGNLVEKQSGMGGYNKKIYSYDKLGRVISEAFPNVNSKTADIYDDQNKVIFKDENDNRICNVYNSSGKLIYQQDMTGVTTYGDVFQYYEYDKNGALTGEYNNNKTSVDYTYNSDYRLNTKEITEKFTWFNDNIPYGATPAATNENANWEWKNTDEVRKTYHKSYNYSGMHEHSFDGAIRKMKVNSGDYIFVDVRLSSTYAVSEIMIQWKENGSWEHRAYWGSNLIALGTDGTESRKSMGNLPAAGQWHTLVIPAKAVGLEGKTIDGMKFTLYNGEADWDKTGLYRAGNTKVLSKESYTYDDTANSCTNTKVIKTVLGNNENDSTQTVIYTNTSGFEVKSEMLHDTDGNGTKDKTFIQTATYDYMGNKIEEKSFRAYDENWIDPNTNQPYVWTSKYEYDFANRNIKNYNIKGDYSSKSYDALGRLISSADIKGNKANPTYSTTFTYDSMGRLIKEQIPFEKVGSTIFYQIKKHYYDRNNNQTCQMINKNKSSEAEEFEKTSYEYDNRNLLVKVITYDNNNPVNYTQYYYDPAGNGLRMYSGLSSPLTINGLDDVTPGLDNDYSVTKLRYDRFNRVDQTTDPLNRSETLTYDLYGNVISKTDRKNSIITYSYDGLNRNISSSVTCTDSSANVAYTYTFDAKGNRGNSTSGNISNYFYDDMMNPVAKKESKQELTPVFSSKVTALNVTNTNFGTSSFVTRADGKILGTYSKNDSIMLSTVNSEDDLFSTTNAFSANETVFYTRYSTTRGILRNSELQKLANGNYLLFINEHGVYGDSNKPNKVIVYESTDGGVSFSYKSTIRSFSMTSYTNVLGFNDCSVGNAIQLSSGRILVPFNGVYPFSGSNGKLAIFCAYSDDNGATWTVSNVETANNYACACLGIAKCGNQLIMDVSSYYSGGSIRFKYSLDNGQTWTAMTTSSTSSCAYSQIFWGEGDGYSYWLYRVTASEAVTVYRRKDTLSLSTTNQEPYSKGSAGSSWEGPLNPSAIMGNNLIITAEGTIAVTGQESNPYGNKSILYSGTRKGQNNHSYNAIGSNTSDKFYQNGIEKYSTGYTYDELNRMGTVVDGTTTIATYSYDDNGNRNGLSYLNGNSTVYTFNLANKIVTLTNKNGGTTISQFTYTYYLNGRIASKTDSNGTTTYVYDGLGRLATVTEPGNVITTYQYDDYNNRSFMSVVDGSTITTYTYSYDLASRLSSIVKRVNGSIVSTTNYAFDNNGNMTSDGTQTFKYDGFNRLIEVTSGTDIYKYSYDGDGKRTSKSVNGTITNFVWSGENVTYELDASGNAIARYIQGINPIAYGTGSTLKYYLYNGHGDVIQLADSAGNVIKNYNFDAFGNEKNIDPTDPNVLRYSGEYFDKETGAIYLRSRYYDPEIGRFINEDSISGRIDDPLSLNLYTYCTNDPIDYVDPSGNLGVDTVFTLVDIYNFVKEPSLSTGAWVALDILLAADVSGALSAEMHIMAALKRVEKAGSTADKLREYQNYVKVLNRLFKDTESYKLLHGIKSGSKSKKIVSGVSEVKLLPEAQISSRRAAALEKQRRAVQGSSSSGKADFIVTQNGTVMPTNKDFNLVDSNTPTNMRGDWFQIHNTHGHGSLGTTHTHYPEINTNGSVGNTVRRDITTTAEHIDWADFLIRSGKMRERINRKDLGGPII